MEDIWDRLRRGLAKQHMNDLAVYRRAHQEWRNRILHWIMIPVECWALFLFFTAILPPSLEASIILVTGCSLGFLSMVVATKPSLGLASCFFHLILIWSCLAIKSHLGVLPTVLLSLGSWTIAWMFQVGIGHWLFERNQPNVANMNEVSYLAVCQSVLIAWAS
jgi:uncharacterized membrane protein YGL010W